MIRGSFYCLPCFVTTYSVNGHSYGQHMVLLVDSSFCLKSKSTQLKASMKTFFKWLLVFKQIQIKGGQLANVS